jgi:hypothetical protein
MNENNLALKDFSKEEILGGSVCFNKQRQVNLMFHTF